MTKYQGYLRMKIGSTDQISSDLKQLQNAAVKLASDVVKVGVATSILQWIASFAAIYLLILDRTNWKTNILTALLVPYIFFSLPLLLFNIVRGQIGQWIAIVAVILRLFFPSRYPDWLEFPASLIIIVVVAPSLLADTVKGSWIGALICLIIGCYLLQEHIRAAGGFRNAFTKAVGISNTLGIIALFIYPVWYIIVEFI